MDPKDTRTEVEDVLVLGTAGHIDHGKSTLVQALTGIDPDRLAEEKRRGITIELGFAQLELDDGTRVGVVDVPGHERFVRQMISGATGIDLALLCIASDDGVMPQTREHVDVLRLLGVTNVVVALTKTDLVDDEWVELVGEEVRAYLATTPYADAPMVPVSARSGSGLPELRATLTAMASTIKRDRPDEAARMPVDRSFTIKGAGTVVTGTLWSGAVALGDELELLPGCVRTRIRSIQEHGHPVDRASAGARVAMNLHGVTTMEVRPGMWLATPGTLEPTDRFDARLTFLGADGEQDDILQSGVTIRVAHGTSEVCARALVMGEKTTLARGDVANVQLRLDEPLCVGRGDRFVIRSMTPVRVIGGGEVILAHPRRRTTLSGHEATMIDALVAHDVMGAIDAATAAFERPVTASEVAHASGIGFSAVEDRLNARVLKGEIVELPQKGESFYVAKATLNAHASAITNALMRFHASNPNALGQSPADLRQALGTKPSTSASYAALLAYLAAQGQVVMNEGVVSHPKASAGARKAEEAAVGRLVDAVRAQGRVMPAAADLGEVCGLDPGHAKRILGVAAKVGQVVAIADFVTTPDVLDGIWGDCASFIGAHGPSTAAELKDALGISRKYAIPLLEYFDSLGWTTRDESLRTIGPKAPAR